MKKKNRIPKDRDIEELVARENETTSSDEKASEKYKKELKVHTQVLDKKRQNVFQRREAQIKDREAQEKFSKVVRKRIEKQEER